MGFNNQRNISPLSDRSILKIDNEAIVYDIIYDPSPSLLLKKSMDRNLKILDGKKIVRRNDKKSTQTRKKTHLKSSIRPKTKSTS